MPFRLKIYFLLLTLGILSLAISVEAYAQQDHVSSEIVDLQMLMYDTIKETYPQELDEYRARQEFPTSSDKLHNVMTSEYKSSQDIYADDYKTFLEPFHAPTSSDDLRKAQTPLYKNTYKAYSEQMNKYDSNLKTLHNALNN